MAFEIEHKYLVKNKAYRDMAVAVYEIQQAYIDRNAAHTVRIRKKNDKYFLTIKGKTIKDTRHEVEFQITESDYEELFALCEGKIINKTRYLVRFEGYDWEVDEFHDDDKLIIAEIELKTSHKNYPLPPFIGAEVTGETKYYNSQM